MSDVQEMRCEERYGRTKERLDKQEKKLDDIQRLTIEMSELNKSLAASMKEQGKRIAALEEKPTKKWDLVISGIISAAVAALMAFVLK